MISKMPNLNYKEITEENILFATHLEMQIFPSSCGYFSYLKAYENGAPYFLAYLNNEAFGITGLYEEERLGEKGTVWLGWYGILKNYRGRGLGKAILLDTIKEAENRKYETLRLYTSEKLCPEACILYDKVMDLGENYTVEEKDLKRKVYSKSLNGKPVKPWENKFLYLEENHKEEEQANKFYIKLLNKN